MKKGLLLITLITLLFSTPIFAEDDYDAPGWSSRFVEYLGDKYIEIWFEFKPVYRIRIELFQEKKCVVRDVFGRFSSWKRIPKMSFSCSAEVWEDGLCRMVMREHGRFATWLMVPCITY